MVCHVCFVYTEAPREFVGNVAVYFAYFFVMPCVFPEESSESVTGSAEPICCRGCGRASTGQQQQSGLFR